MTSTAERAAAVPMLAALYAVGRFRGGASAFSGTRKVPCDFMGFCQTLNPIDDHHDLLTSNLLAERLFEHENLTYRDSVLPPRIAARVAVEEASTFGWERYAGFGGTILGRPMKVVAQHFGFELAHVVAAAREQMARHGAK